MPGTRDLVTRLLSGQGLRSDRRGETLLPERIALPVLAGDALSPLAYAPDAILLTLSIAGLAAYGYSWQLGLVVVLVMLVGVASRHQAER